MDLVATTALAGVVIYLGHGVRKLVPPLARWNLPAPVIGGLIVASILTATRSADGKLLLSLDNSLQQPLMIAFFCAIGFGASFSLLERGGAQVVVLLVISTIAAVLQNVIGAGVAVALGEAPLLGVMAGSLTLTGGPATGLAFADQFEEAGIRGAATIAVAAGMAGIVSGGLMGGPIATWLLERHRLRPGGAAPAGAPASPPPLSDLSPEPAATDAPGDDPESSASFRSFVALLVAMGLGGWLSAGIKDAGVTLPATVGAMLVGAAIRNFDDLTGWLRLSPRILDEIGNAALTLFLAMAIMTLKLWDLAGLALPLAIIIAVQVVVIVVLCLVPVFRVMGRDYEAAVMSSGFCGFMLGTTANAMANMKAVVDRHGPAPRAFLAVPIVGACFIDFANALLINYCLVAWR